MGCMIVEGSMLFTIFLVFSSIVFWLGALFMSCVVTLRLKLILMGRWILPASVSYGVYSAFLPIEGVCRCIGWLGCTGRSYHWLPNP